MINCNSNTKIKKQMDYIYSELKKFSLCNILKDSYNNQIEKISTPIVKNILNNKYSNGNDMNAVLCLFNNLFLSSAKFKENGLKAKVDLKTGEVVLLSGEGFNFEKGSARLSKEAKNILRKIIPIYAEVLLGDDNVYKQISSINMEGHSSVSLSVV